MKSKPHLYYRRGRWYCRLRYSHFCAEGASPREAYWLWRELG